MSARIPLHVLTGFLGSGKTTLLNRILRDPAWRNSAVIINEFGTIPLDHDLVERSESDGDLDILVLKGGCTCCALRGDLAEALLRLYERRARGDIPPFARVIMETSGLADPAPVLFTVGAQPTLRHKFERGLVVTTFDAVHGSAALRAHPEARKQIALADRVVVTKADVSEAAPFADCTARVAAINPAAAITDARDALSPSELLGGDDTGASGTSDAYGVHKDDDASRQRDAALFARGFDARAAALGGDRPNLQQPLCEDVTEAEHSRGITHAAFTLDTPVDWPRFAVWLTLLTHAHGDRLLRVKALLHVRGGPNAVALDAVHHMIHPPRHLAGWDEADRTSRLVFIGQDLPTERIEASLRAFLAAGDDKAPMAQAET